MDFALSEVQEVFKSTAQKFFKEKCTVSMLKEFEENNKGYSLSLYKEMADLGLLGLIIPEEYGGAGGNLMDLAIVIEEAGYACLPAPFLSTISYGVLPLINHGTEAQKRDLLPKIASGELIFTSALSEPQAHYDLKHITSFADKSGGEYSLSGSKLFVPFADSADYLLTLARTIKSSDVSSEGLSLFLVKGNQSGVQTSQLPSIGSDRLFEVDLQEANVSAGDILGEVDNGWTITQKTLQMATALQCIEMAGVLRRALEVTRDYVKERMQFGRTIGSFQSVQHRLADMYTMVEGGRLAAYQAIWKFEKGVSAEREVSIAKTWLGMKGQDVLVGAHQLHGGVGLDMDYPLQFCFRRFKSMQLNLGPAPIHLKRIGQSLSKKSVADASLQFLK
ncbi:acyl-CoA dehydrogenase family protein [Peribacillus sp. NPDC097675]|uniref:acyl-CoA dehydrogenase family protein n=1 Tax=Peribacillus sp. NPDC097675 TaxID=3390618 RepID=UPI003D0494D3